MSKERKTVMLIGDVDDEVIVMLSESRLTVLEARELIGRLYAAAMRIEDHAKIKPART